MRYKLTGSVVFKCDGHDVKLVIEPEGMMDLKYTLLLDGKPVKDDIGHKEISYWLYEPATGGTKARIEWDHRNFEVFVDMIKVETEGDFLEEGDGSLYKFDLPDGVPAAIVVTAHTDGKDRAELKVGEDASSQKVLRPVDEEEEFVPPADKIGGPGAGAGAGASAAGGGGEGSAGAAPAAGSAGDRLGPASASEIDSIGDVAAAAAAVATAAAAAPTADHDHDHGSESKESPTGGSGR